MDTVDQKACRGTPWKSGWHAGIPARGAQIWMSSAAKPPSARPPRVFRHVLLKRA